MNRSADKPELSTEDIAARYLAGESSHLIAADLKCSVRTIFLRLAKAGVPPRPIGNGHPSGPANKRWQGGKKASWQRWQERHPERRSRHVRANMQVAYAIRKGRLTRAVACEECGRGNIKIQAAHFDYSEPLRVRWLCHPCHRKWDAAQPKTLAAINDASVYAGHRHGEAQPRAKLTEDKVRALRRAYESGTFTQARLADFYGVSQPLIGKIVRRELWRHVM